MSRALLVVFGLLMVSSASMVLPVAAQGNPMPAVNLDCPSGSVEIDVSPSGNAPFNLVCELSNPSSLDETIEISTDVDVNEISLSASQSSVDLPAGESTFVTFSFSAGIRTSVVGGDFSLGAKVVSAKIPLVGQSISLMGPLAAEDFHNGTAATKLFHYPVLEITDKSTRQVDSGDSLSIFFTVLNDGNGEDIIEVKIANVDELKSAGFRIDGVSFHRIELVAGATSAKTNFTIECPEGSSSQISETIKIEAASFIDPSSSVVSSSEVDVQVSAEESGGLGLSGAGLEVLQDENTRLLLMAGGGGIGLLVILVIFLKMTRRSKKTKSSTSSSVSDIPVEEEDEFDDEFDDLDEAFADLDDLEDIDDAFADLDDL